jgi:FKBP-type peptidyl-prolyl cis-trans isomerase SlyD
MKIAAGTIVTFEYVLADEHGTVLDSSGDSGPLTYVHGEGRIVPGLERALAGRDEGERFRVVVPPEDAYGWHDPERVEMVPKTSLDPSGAVTPGMRFEAHTEKGIVIATVVGVEGEEARIDANHPLAGTELHFEVRVVSVRKATESETSTAP